LAALPLPSAVAIGLVGGFAAIAGVIRWLTATFDDVQPALAGCGRFERAGVRADLEIVRSRPDLLGSPRLRR
jgi:hypothetical protein